VASTGALKPGVVVLDRGAYAGGPEGELKQKQPYAQSHGPPSKRAFKGLQSHRVKLLHHPECGVGDHTCRALPWPPVADVRYARTAREGQIGRAAQRTGAAEVMDTAPPQVEPNPTMTSAKLRMD